MLITKSKKYPNTLKVSHVDSYGLKVLGKIDLLPKKEKKYFLIFLCACKTLVTRHVETITEKNLETAYRFAIDKYKMKPNGFVGVKRGEIISDYSGSDLSVYIV